MSFHPGMAHSRQAPQSNSQPSQTGIATPLTASVNIPAASQDLISRQLVADYNNFPMRDFRLRFELLDLAYYMENSEHLRTTRASRIITTIYKELELPILQPNIDAAHAFLTGLFLAERPIFSVVSDSIEKSTEAKQMEAIVGENSTQTGWARQLSMCLKNALKYNIGAVSVEWLIRESFKFITDTNVSFTEAVVETTMRAGNEIVNHDMYNTFYDTSVAAGDVYKDGDFGGSVDRLTAAQLHRYITDLSANQGVLMNVKDNSKLWQSSVYHNWYFEPNVLNEDTVHTGTDWNRFFYTVPRGSGPMQFNNLSTYERVRYHRRIIPSVFGIRVPDANKLQLWYFVEINNIIIYAERKTTAHQHLPMIFFQPIEDSLRHQTKGLGANLKPYQNLSGTMYRAKIASLARSLSDRGLYDPNMVSEKDINSVIPTAKIPVRPKGYGTKISDAYFPIPYDDTNARSLYQDIGFVDAQAEKIAHINKAQKGQFTKGNRTAEEFNEIMGNADSPQLAMALLLEYQAFTPLKYIVKVNILQYQNVTAIEDPNTNELVTIDPVELRKAIVNFKLADGLVTEDELLGAQETIQAFQVMSTTAEGNVEYDLVGMMAEVMGRGNSRLSKWKRTPEDRERIIKQRAQLTQPTQPAQQQEVTTQ